MGAGNATPSGVTGWIKQPFSAQMDVLQWVLFLGFGTIVVLGWVSVVKHIEG